MALDLKAAFDNVSQKAILNELDDLQCGTNIFNNVNAFLVDRTATIRVCEVRSDKLRMPEKGTPTGLERLLPAIQYTGDEVS